MTNLSSIDGISTDGYWHQADRQQRAMNRHSPSVTDTGFWCLLLDLLTPKFPTFTKSRYQARNSSEPDTGGTNERFTISSVSLNIHYWSGTNKFTGLPCIIMAVLEPQNERYIVACWHCFVRLLNAIKGILNNSDN